ncbi:hypothetical protein [Paenibacillus xylanexedens]|uniref:hypothetical protein n=1 Tax=Paenibacillus xylanexedens TaxID=528191 RepID=UPI0011A74D0A|nr:hypothetical protein [Paenibacillus xylanexedens]
MEYSLLKVHDNEYLLSLVNFEEKIVDEIEHIFIDLETFQIDHMVSSSSSRGCYEVYELSGEDVGELVIQVRNLLNKYDES